MAMARKQGKPTDYMFMDEPEKEPTILDSPFNGQMAWMDMSMMEMQTFHLDKIECFCQ